MPMIIVTYIISSNRKEFGHQQTSCSVISCSNETKGIAESDALLDYRTWLHPSRRIQDVMGWWPCGGQRHL